jgi:hypothetical protein
MALGYRVDFRTPVGIWGFFIPHAPVSASFNLVSII